MKSSTPFRGSGATRRAAGARDQSPGAAHPEATAVTSNPSVCRHRIAASIERSCTSVARTRSRIRVTATARRLPEREVIPRARGGIRNPRRIPPSATRPRNPAVIATVSSPGSDSAKRVLYGSSPSPNR